MSRPAVSRADLVRCYRQSPDGLDAFADLLGFERAHRREEAPVPSDLTMRDVPAAPPVERPIAMKGVTFWQHTATKLHVVDTSTAAAPPGSAPRTVNELREALVVPPPNRVAVHPPLIPWSKLWAFARAALGTSAPSHRVDVRSLVRTIAQGHAVRRVPRLARSTWAAQAQVVIDRDLRLAPFWQDQKHFVDRLKMWRGKLGLDIYYMNGGPCAPVTIGPETDNKPYAPPSAHVPILVLSDLGLLDSHAGSGEKWAVLGRRLAAPGRIPTALLPCPRHLWRYPLDRLWRLACWDRGQPLPNLSKPRDAGLHRLRAADPRRRQRALDRLLGCLAPLVNVEPALLRSLRFALADGAVDVAIEAEAWHHPHVNGANTSVMGLRRVPGVRRPHRVTFENETPHVQRHMFELAHAHHFAGEQREFLLEELCHFAALGIAPPEFEQLARRQFRLVCDHLATLDPTQPESVLVSFWAQRVAMQMPPQALRWNELSDCLRLATELMSQVQPHARFDVPEGLNIWPAPPTQEHDPSGAWWRLWQCGNKQTIRPVEDQVPPPPPPNVPGGSLAFIRAGGPWFEVRCQADQAIAPGPAQRHWLCAGPGHEAGVDIGGVHTIEVISDRQIISLTPVSSSSWHRMGCDGYGLYAEICIAGIAHRMRWIGPGTFQMGSPEDEPERYPDERLHQVTLTRGFWLGETACPQSLWQAVIGNNPSRFKNEGKSGSGADRPVENVSWEDCQAFFDKANGLLDRDDLRLPTEAEWEYACRAGTVSPFWFGQELTSEQANFSETKREETAGVMEFPCNGWGLYQMHGNVWEWCQDWYTQSLEGPAEDPQGPNEGAARVLRGGSWIKSARICRSACRFWYLPSDRYENLGFRLARGQ